MKNNKDIFVPTEIEKEKMIEHIMYEMNMFRFCYENLSIIKEEAFLLHARNLYTFFYSNVRIEDDITARDYLINIEDFFSKSSQQDEFKDFTPKWNKMLNHLTYSRLDYIEEKKRWDWPKLFLLIDKTEKAFFSSLSKDKKEWFLDR